jgi:VanZ family protein
VRSTRRLSELKNFFLAAALLWTTIVTVLCLVSLSNLPKIEVEGFDKLGHLSFHIGIVALWYLYFLASSNMKHEKSLTKAVAFSLVFGVVIEVLQETLTEARTAELKDVLANVTGAAIAALIITILNIYFNKVSANK